MDAVSHESPAASPVQLEWGVAARPLNGQLETGDKYIVAAIPHGMLVAVVDALGHGKDAAAAAELAIATLREHAHEPVVALLRRCDAELRRTRGAVMSLAAFNAQATTMTWCGVGNVEGVLLSAGAPRQSIVLRGGVVGYRLPPLNATALAVRPGDTLILATDGVRSGFAEAVSPTASPQDLADRILTGFARDSDDALVLVARFVGVGS